jgi:hypothetical protein
MIRNSSFRCHPIGFARGTLLLAGAALLGSSCKDPTIGADFNTGMTTPIGGDPRGSLAEDCPAGDDWIPGDGSPPPPVRQFTPAPHPDTECPFYRGAYQNFLIATVPLGKNAAPGQSPSDPALVNYATIDDAFTFTNPHLTRNTGTSYPWGKAGHDAVASGPATGRAWLGAVRQAGQRNVLIDQDDHTLYYGLHMNQAFFDFIHQNKLDTPEGIANVDPYLSFPPGLVEFKTAWKDIDPLDFPDANNKLGTPNGIVPPPPLPDDLAQLGGQQLTWDDNYITTMAWLPYLTQDAAGIVHEDPDHPVLRKVALVALHSVYTLPGHPEFIWGSIQHVNIHAIDPGPVAYAGFSMLGAPDSQPNNNGPGGMAALPDPNDPQNSNQKAVASTGNYLLYKGGTSEDKADQPLDTSALHFDEATQSFPGQGAQSSVYRMFPGSKSNDLAPDGAVFSLNSNLNYAFAKAISQGIDPKVDKRQNYRLVAAVWLDKPNFFGLTYPGPAPGLGPDGKALPLGGAPQGVTFQNDDTNPLVIGASQDPAVLYPDVSQGVTCGTPLDSAVTSGNDPNATGANNTVPTCPTRADDLAAGDSPSQLYKGRQPDGSFGAPTVGTDYEFSLLGGEDRLSSTSMETFTQNNGFRNCFTCHNTKPVNVNGVPAQGTDGPADILLSKPALINVSHLFSEFILQNREQSGM